MNYLEQTRKKWCLSALLVFGLTLFLSNEVAIPGPLPEPSVSEAKESQTPELVFAPEATDLFKTGHMDKILSRFHTGLHPSENKNLVVFISKESREYGFDPELILALIATESSFYNWSVSKKGAMGLMQIVPETGKALAKATQIAWPEKNKQLFDPYVNVKLGIHYLYSLNKQFKDIRVALAAYNFGPTKVRRWIRRGRPIPTRYANKVLRSYKSYLASNLQNRIIPGTSDQSFQNIPNPNDT